MANETTQTSAFDSTPDSQMYEYKQSIEKVQTELLKYGLTANQSKVFIYLGKYGAKTAPEVCKALKLPRTETVTVRPVFIPPEITESNPGIPVFTLEYVESISIEKLIRIFYIKRETSLILTSNFVRNYYK